MRLHYWASAAAIGLSSFAGTAAAANQVFSASNLYYAAGLSADEQTTLFEGLKSAGVKVLRVWLDGQNDNVKGTPTTPWESLEGTNGPGGQKGWDDTVLERLDDVMVKAHDYGIKLLISIHSYNTLKGNNDFYGKWYGTGDFYSNEDSIQYFKDRIAHVMSHKNPHNGKTWAQSSEYIFAFEAQNEADHDDQNRGSSNPWQCTMAQAIKDNLDGNDGILTTTGGGSYMADSLQDSYFSCDALDVLAIHAYGTGDFDTNQIKNYVSKAQGAGKKLMMQEWGACYTDASNNNCNGGSPLDSGTRGGNIRKWASQIASAGVPWAYWQILPNEDPHSGWDYEVGINGVNWDDMQQAGVDAASHEGAWDWSKWLL